MPRVLILDKAQIDNIVFTRAILHTMLIEHGVWEDDNDDEDIAADIPENIMDERIINIRNGPVDQSYAGCCHSVQPNIDAKSEWAILGANLIQNYMYCFRMNQIEW